MKNDFNIELINLIQNGIAVKYNLGRLYDNNIGFMYSTLKQCNVRNKQLQEDLLQVSFFAVYDSAMKFSVEKNNNYLSYFRLWLIHYYYRELLRMQYSFRITDTAYNKAKSLNNLSSFIATDITELTKDEIALGISNGSLITTLQFEDRYKTTLAKEIWGIVKDNLTERNYKIIEKRFKYSISYEKIGFEFGICKESVRQRVLRSLTRLSSVEPLKIIASDWYGISVYTHSDNL